MAKEYEQVFIASRFSEFKELRSLIVDDINSIPGMQPIDLDDNLPDGKLPLSKCFENINISEYFILLMGETYGEEKVERTNYSYTHLEYKEAIKNPNINILVYGIGPSYEDKSNIKFSDNPDLKNFQEEVFIGKHTYATYPNQNNKNEIVRDIRKKLLTEMKRIKTLNIFDIETNRQNLIKNNNIVQRDKEFKIVNDFFHINQEESSLLFITGNAGIGKSSFLIDYFNSIDKNTNKFIYFISGEETDDEKLNNLYNNLLLKFKFLMNNDIELKEKIKSIDENLNISDKFNYIFNLYNEYFSKYNKNIIIIIDSIDLVTYQESLLNRLIHPYKGINFLISGRENKFEKNLKKLQLENIFFKVFANNKNEYKLNLEPISIEIIEKIISNDLVIFNELNSLKQKQIINLLEKKSNGLPIYLRFQIENLNKKIKEENILDNKIINFIDSLPSSLEDYYKLIFNNFSANSKKVLQILYWFDDYISIDYVYQFLNEIDKDEIDKALSDIKYLLTSFEDKIKIHHLSIKEALFKFYQYDEKKITSVLINKELISNFLRNEHFIFESLEDTEYLYKYSEIIYFHNSNILFQTLAKICEILLNSKKTIIPYNNFLILFDQYIELLQFSENIKIEYLTDNSKKFSEIFNNFKISPKIGNLTNKFFTLFINYQVNDIYELNRLLKIANISQNYYFYSKYTKEYLSFNIESILDGIINSNELLAEDYDKLNTVLLKTYISRICVLSNKETKLHIYNDRDIVLFLNKFKNNKSKEENLINSSLSIINNVKKRQLLEQYKRVTDIIKYTRNSKLLEKLVQLIYLNLKFSKNKEKLNLENYNSFSEEIKYEINLNTVKSFDKSNPNFKYLSSEYKLKINKFNQLYSNYINNGIENLLKESNSSYFNKFGNFLNENDFIHFFNFYIKNFEEEKLILEVLQNLIINTENTENLNYFLSYILNKFDFKSNKQVLILLINIYYKTNNLKSLLELKEYIINIETIQEERSVLSKIMNNCNNLMDSLNIYSKYSNIKNLKIPLNRQLNFNDFNKILDDNISDLNFINRMITNYFHFENELENKKRIFLKYKDILNNKDTFILNILIEDKPNDFINMLKKQSIFQQENYLQNNLEYRIQTHVPLLDTEDFWNYILSFYEKGECNEFLISLIKQIYFKEQFMNFCFANISRIESIYKLYENFNTNNEVKIKYYFFAILSILKNKLSYKSFFLEDWIKKEMIEVNTIKMLLFHSPSIEIIEEIIPYLEDELTLVQVYFYIGIKYVNKYHINNGYQIYSQLNENKKKLIENYFIYSLPKILNNKDVAELLNIFMIDNYIIKNFSFKKIFYSMELNFNFLANTELEKQLSLLDNSDMFIKEYIENFTKDSMLEEFKFDENIYTLLKLYAYYKKAEQDDNEELYNKCETIFEQFKEKILRDNTKLDFFNKNFENFQNLTLDTLFINYKIFNDEDDLDLSINLIKNDYDLFYSNLKKISKKYENALSQNFDEEIVILENLLEKLKYELKENNEIFEILKEKSSVKSLLSIKFVNIDNFKPLN